MEGDYKEGEHTGHWIRWYDNGQKKEEGDYGLDDMQTGKWTTWDANGNPKVVDYGS